MEKFSSQSNNKNNNRPRDGESGKVAALPLQSEADKPQATGRNDQQQQLDEQLQKDLELLARMREQIDQLPEIDAARIVQLHERILRGDYKIDSESLANKLRVFESDFQKPSS